MQKHKRKKRERESGNHETSAIWLWSLNQVRERDESVISKWILTSEATFDEFNININTNITLWNSKHTNLDWTLSHLHKKSWTVQLNYIFQNGLLKLIIPIDIYVTIKFASHTSPWNLRCRNLIKWIFESVVKIIFINIFCLKIY
jgi:hypothetical protein